MWQTNVWNPKTKDPGHTRHLIVTVEQLFKSREGHFPRLALLLRNQTFQKLIRRINVDEAHNIHTSGLPHYGLEAFCPAWGRLGKLKALLPSSIRYHLFSATFPPHILATVEKKVMRTGYSFIHITSNRPNTVYATHQVVNSANEMRNYECFLSEPYNPETQPHILIFVDNRDTTDRITSHLDSCLPKQYRDQGIVSHYHSNMSEHYLQTTHDAFTKADGKCRILVSTSSQSVV